MGNDAERDRIRARAYAETRAALAADGPHAATRRLQRLLDDELKRLPAADRGPVACAAGCSMCCYVRVAVTDAEVATLLGFIDSTFDDSAKAALRERVRSAADALHALPAERLLTTNVACPVLVDGRCSAYAARPFNCRAYHSLDRAACQASYDAPDDLSRGHPQLTPVARVHEGAQQGFVAALRDAGADAAQRELATALAAALGDTRAALTLP